MSWTAPPTDRTPIIGLGDERTQLEAWLDFHRETLLLKCAGLTADQLRTASVKPSTMTLLGLVRHMAEVERWWFRRSFGGQKVGDLYCSEQSPDGDFDDLDTADAEADFATFHREVEAARAAAAGHGLDEEFTSRRGKQLHLRWVYLHMIEEYARHNGHADLIRERIDGTAGV